MPEFIAIDATIDTTKWDAAIAHMLGDARRVQNLFKSVEIPIQTDVDDSDLKSLEGRLDDVDAGVTSEIRTALDDSDLKSAEKRLDSVDAGVTSEVDVSSQEAVRKLGDIEAQLANLKNLATIDVVMQVPEFLSNAAGLPLVGSIVEMDTALARIQGRTGKMIPDAEYLIRDLYTGGWGESRQAIADVITQADNLKISTDDLEDAVRNAFFIQDIDPESDPREILRTMDSLIKNDLVPDFNAAADVLATGLQIGANRGQDLLDTFNEYGSTFAQLRITGPGALALINSGLDAGVDNSDRIADALRETGIRLKEIADNPAIADAFKELDKISDIDLKKSLDAFNAGEISGDEFFEGFFGALEEANRKDPARAAVIAATLVGTIAEDFGVEAVSQLSPKWDETMGALEGRAATASNAINDTLGVALDSLTRTIETEMADALNEALDIEGLIDKAKEAVNTFSTEIKRGATVGEALEIALDIPEGTIGRIESAFGNLAIALLEIAANIGEFLGKDVSGLRAQLKEAAETQLVFDLKFAETADDLANITATALSRGLSTADVQSAIETTVSESLAAGNFEQAQEVIDNLSALKETPIEIDVGGFQGVGMLPTQAFDTAGVQEQVDTYVDQINAAFDRAISAGDTGEAQRLGELLGMTTGEVNEFMAEFGPSMEGLATATVTPITTIMTAAMEEFQGTMDTTATETDTSANKMTGAFSTMREAGQENFPALINSLGAVGQAIVFLTSQAENALARMIELANAATSARDAIGGAADAAGGGGGGSRANPSNETDTGLQHGGMGRGAFWTGEAGRELVFSDPRVAVLGHQSSEALASAVRALMPTPAGGGGGRSITVNVYNNFQTQSLAQDGAALQRMANAVRGYY